MMIAGKTIRMSAADTTTPATAETHSAATLPERLPLDGITLLGTVVAGDASRVMIRLSNGTIQQLRIGENIGNATVAAIEPGLIHMIRNGETQRLAMP